MKSIAQHFKAAAIGWMLAASAMAAHSADIIRIGSTPGVTSDAVEAVATEARAQGLEVKLVEFTDWTLPNEAVNNADIDLNFFQHRAWLHARTPRTRCGRCGVHLASVPWARPNSGFTLLFEAFALMLAVQMPIAQKPVEGLERRADPISTRPSACHVSQGQPVTGNQCLDRTQQHGFTQRMHVAK